MLLDFKIFKLKNVQLIAHRLFQDALLAPLFNNKMDKDPNYQLTEKDNLLLILDLTLLIVTVKEFKLAQLALLLLHIIVLIMEYA